MVTMIKGICQECHKLGAVHVHHKDGNHENDARENRAVLCPSCRHILAHKEYLPPDWKPEPLPWAEVRRQYFTCFPRA